MPTLFWFLAYIHVHSQQQEFLSEVLNYTSSPSSPNLKAFDFKNLTKSELLNSGFKETLRMQAHSITPRDLLADTMIVVEGKEYLLKKGSLALAPNTLVNHNPEIYKNPKEWFPERFLQRAADDEISAEGIPTRSITSKGANLPLLIWGGGSHMVCIN